jgi:hypothetical protein
LDPFRKLAKRRVQVLLPADLDDRVRAVRGRRSLSALVASALCRYLEVDPADFGMGGPPASSEASPATPPDPAGPPG